MNIKEITVLGNSRKQFFTEAIQELADSIKSVGLLQPIGVIADGKKYRLLYGERRLRACIVNKMKEIDVNVFENLSEHEMTLIHITENIQRRDLTAFEEMSALTELKDKGMSVEDIAAKIGRSLKFIYDRINLNLLIPEFLDKLQDSTLSVSLAKELIRLTKEDQYELFLMWGDGFQINELKDLIKKSFNLKLANAPFLVSDETLLLGAGACTDCSKRSGCTSTLFEGYETADICFDKKCYAMKVANHLEATEQSWVKMGVDVIRVTDRWISESDRNAKGVRLLNDLMQIPKEAIKNHERKAIALIVDSFGKVGRYVDVLSDSQRAEYDNELKALQPKSTPDKRSKSFVEAEVKFMNDLLGNVAREVTVNEFKAIPRGFRVSNIIGLFLALPLDERIEIAEARSWTTFPGYTTLDPKQLADRQAVINTVYKNIKHASDKTIREFEFTLQVFMLKGLHVNSESFELVTGIASDCNVDTGRILGEVNEQFGVSIEVELF